jgi:hypothetical protein
MMWWHRLKLALRACWCVWRRGSVVIGARLEGGTSIEIKVRAPALIVANEIIVLGRRGEL